MTVDQITTLAAFAIAVVFFVVALRQKGKQ